MLKQSSFEFCSLLCCLHTSCYLMCLYSNRIVLYLLKSVLVFTANTLAKVFYIYNTIESFSNPLKCDLLTTFCRWRMWDLEDAENYTLIDIGATRFKSRSDFTSVSLLVPCVYQYIKCDAYNWALLSVPDLEIECNFISFYPF